MIEVLDSLSSHPGILGCLVATTDGMVVASRLQDDLDDDTAAALVSSLLMSTSRLLDGCGGPQMDQLILRATRGKIVVTHLGNSYLVVVTDGYLDLNEGLIEIQSAAQQLRRLGRIPA